MNQQHTSLVLILLAISTGLLGLSMGLMGHHRHIELVTDFYHITPYLPKGLYNLVAAVGFVATALLALVSIKQPRWRPHLGSLLVVISVIPLLSLFGSTMWIDALGGFPAIGSGQGVIKYAALLAVGILLIRPELPVVAKKWLSAIPVLLVLVWIGGMKFTELEAKGIEDLVASSPLMAWMYSLWDVQTTSNIIGVYDLIAVVLVIGAIFNQRLLYPALLMSGAVFAVTQSFLLTWDGALSDTLLSTGGHFLIKDLWFIANLIFFWQAAQPAKQAL